MKLSQTKGMVAPALGVGVGMLASPKITSVSPFLSKYPFISPIILLLIALALLGYPKARSFGIGLGAIALVFLAMVVYNKVKGVTTGAPVGEAKEPWSVESTIGWIEKTMPSDRGFGDPYR